MVVRSAAGEALAWVTVWTRPSTPASSSTPSGRACPAGIRGVNATPSENARTYLVPSTAQRGARTVTVRASEIGGRPIVVYIDVPAGLPSDLIAIGAITLR
jgi:hypothetical protein